MERKNVLFLLIDCLRADACHGTSRQVCTPVLDALCHRGTVFTQAISVAGSTPVCMASLFTGMYPFVHGIRPLSINRFYLSTTKLNPDCRTLVEILRDSGYDTYATVTGPMLDVTDLHRGFQRYQYREKDDIYLHQGFGKGLTKLLSDLNSEKAPWFLFVHLWELHAPRQVSPEFNSARYGSNRYERAVSSLDLQLGEILKEVDFGSTLVVIHGDHGEGTRSPFEFLLHPMLHDRIGIKLMRLFYNVFFKWIHQYRSLQGAHGLNLFDDIVRVPLILIGPGIPEGRIIGKQVSQVDIMPTLLDLLGMKADHRSSIHGRSLYPLITGEQWEERPVYMEAYSGKSVSHRYLPMKWVGARFSAPPALVGIRTSQWKCLWVPEDPRIRPELYDLKGDPSELKDLFTTRPEVTAELQAHLSRIGGDGWPVEPHAGMTPEEQARVEKRLRELGYL